MHLLVGLNGAGKSTLARSIAKRDGAVRLSLDASMRQLHPAGRRRRGRHARGGPRLSARSG
ncbi:AAA family ATPase [Agrococcus sp. BE272]|uniref:AAA family ATPase n=1 Tax=Agrococcus sp. BE272 TaxID=2817727 RepID=UPI0037BFF1EC